MEKVDELQVEKVNDQLASANLDFDLCKVARLFRDCRLQEGVDLFHYTTAYVELNKFFLFLGRIFSFVHAEVVDKTRVLLNHLSSESGHHYQSVRSMLEYELGAGLVHQPFNADALPNGSRTLLRLHRALQFVVKFMASICQTDNDHLASLARAAYDDTLAKHHPWLIRKGVHLAVYTLPSRKQMTCCEIEEALRQLVVEGQEVFQQVDTLYTTMQLNNLA